MRTKEFGTISDIPNMTINQPGVQFASVSAFIKILSTELEISGLLGATYFRIVQQSPFYILFYIRCGMSFYKGSIMLYTKKKLSCHFT